MSSAGDPSSRATKLLDEIEALLRRGNKIGAIKADRTATRTGLKEANDTADAIESAMKAKGSIEVDRARPDGLLKSMMQALARWRGQPD